jgi:O-antigen/teichoic acid export membrane protein
MEALKEKTIRAGFVKAWSQAGMFLLRIGTLMVLARLLEPKDFGLVAMVTVVTGVFQLFQDAGLSLATVQRPTITNDQISTLFWVNVLVGTFLGLLSLALAPVLVSFYHEPRLFWVTVLSAAGFIINAAGVQHGALLQRQMRFTALAVIEIVSFSVGGIVGIGMALAGFGYWSLLGYSIAPTFTSTVCLWLSARWIPGRFHRRVGAWSMIGFGGQVTLNSVVGYAASNLDKMLLGRAWGSEALGIYGRAFQLINIPRENLNSAVGLVAMAALSRLQDDRERFRSYFLKGYALVLALVVPMTVAAALLADEIVAVVLGPAWKESAVLLRLLAPTVLIFGLIYPLRWLLFALGLVGKGLRIAVVLGAIAAVSYFLGLPYGPRGLALAYSIAMVAWAVPHMIWSVRGTMVSFGDLVEVASKPVLAALGGGAVAFAANITLGRGLPALARLAIGGGILGFVYLGILLFGMHQKEFYGDLVRNMFRRPRAAGTGVEPASETAIEPGPS